MLKITNLTKKFKGKVALNDINIELNNCVYGMLGENGAGKTTLMRCISRLYDYDSGKIILTQDGKIEKNIGRKIGYLPQSFEGLGELKVQEFMKFFADLKKINKNKIQEEISNCLESVNLGDMKKIKVGNLSGGMRRRLGIAQAMLGNPKLIMFDEPTTGLDPKERIRFQNVIEENRNKDAIIIISTHIVSDIEALSDKIIVMKEGEVLGIYTPKELAGKAEGKVYELSEAEYDKVRKKVILIKISQEVSERKVRVLSEEMLPYKKVDSNVEDGYLWISK